jgi:hypothetical protein
MKAFCAFLLLAAIPFQIPQHGLSQTRSAQNPALVASAERKVQHLQRNGAQARPDPAPTEFTEQEINSYFASGNVKLPVGVRSVAFQEQPGVVTATARVDFDQLKAGRNSYNPLLSVFSGLHDAVVTAHAHGASGQGLVHVDTVQLDGVEIPGFVLEMFVEKYLKPKYPNLGLDSRFTMPARVEGVTIGLHKVAVTQK